MQRGRAGIVGLAIAALVIAVPASAAPAGDFGTPVTQCTITEPLIDELSGLVALESTQILVVEDSTPEPAPGSTSILMYRLDAQCALVDGVVEFPQDPRDIEDLAFQDGSLWFADIGDNAADRANIALISVAYDPADPAPGAPSPVVFRLGYPDGPHDAEALLLAPDGTPYVVTKDPLGRSGVYRPVGELDASAEVTLVKVADLEFTMTGTPGGPVGRAGQVLVTGGAVSLDGSRLALRTYTDAYVWALSGNDVPAALAADPLAVLALPDAPQGEGISFASDSRSLIVGSEGLNSVITAVPATAPMDEPAAQSSAALGSGWSPSDTFDTSPATVTAGLIAVVAVFAVVLLYRRVRRKGG